MSSGPFSATQRYVLLATVFLFIFLLLIYVYLSNSSGHSSNSAVFLSPPPAKAQKPVARDDEKQTIVLIWFWIFGKQFDLDSCHTLLGINGCLITADRNLYDKAHGILIHHRDISWDLSNLPKATRPYFQKWVWMNFESPSNTRRIAGIDNLFNLTMNYRRDADISIHETLIHNDVDREYDIPKKKLLVCWVVSNWNPQHKRVQFYNELKDHININVFGRTSKYLTDQEYLSTMASCKFYLSFENSIHVDYITEKLYKPLILGSVPVALGPTREQYENVVPGEAFIHVDDFSSVKELANYLNFLDRNETEYHRYFSWRRHLQVKGVDFPMEHACRACDYLKRHREQYQAFHNLNKWFWG